MLLAVCFAVGLWPTVTFATDAAGHEWEYSQASTGTTKHHVRICDECNIRESEACDITTATCTTSSICTKCGYHFADAYGHNYKETARTEATCTTNGGVTYTCNREGCGSSYTDPLTMLGHHYVETARTNSTCTVKGSVTYTCDREGCGTSYTEELPLATHNYVARVISATCMEPEIHVDECTKCWDWENLQYVGETLPHQYEEYDRIEPTCTETGISFLMCSGCEDMKEETLAATGHDQEGSLSLMAATCTEPATEYVACSKCGTQQVHGTIGQPLGHDYKETARTNATCTATGSVTYTCDREGCGSSYTDPLTMLGHHYVETARTNSTCTVKGSVTYTCDREGCGTSYTEELPLATHNYVARVISATCMEPEIHVDECTKCWDWENLQYVGETLPHQYEEYDRIEPTCTETGISFLMCSGCEDTKEETLAATGHDQRGTLSLMAATCTEPATEYVACSKCGTQQVHGTIGQPLGHDYKETARTEATCTTNGGVTYTCNREGCGSSYTETLPVTSHSYVKVTTPSTCTEPGESHDECIACGDKINVTTIKVLGHDYKETVRTNSTCTVKGSVTYTCDREGCGSSYTETLPVTSHSYVKVTTPSTCTEPGESHDECTACGDKINVTTIKVLGHDYKETARTNATCTATGSVTYTCNREGCGSSYTETLPVTSHSYVKVTTPSTCTEPGESHDECTACGDKINVITIKAFGHDWTTSDGYTYTCTRCGLTEVDEEAEAEIKASQVPDAVGTVNEDGDLTDLALTSAIKQIGGGYSLRRDDATLNSITLASEKDPENAWMRLNASEPANQLGMQSSFIGDKITLTLTENDEELKITGVSLDGHVLTVTTSSGATFELSTPSIALGYTELDSIAEKNLDRIIFTRTGNVLMIDFGSAEVMKDEEKTELASDTPADTSSNKTPYKVEITFSKVTLTRAPEPESTVAIEAEEEAPMIVIIAYEDEDEVETYTRSICSHQWEYEEEANCKSPRTCTLCGLYEENPSSHCWYVYKSGSYTRGGTSSTPDYYVLKCLYCDATMMETSLNQAQGLCTHPSLVKEMTEKNKDSFIYDTGDSFYSSKTDTSWCVKAWVCKECGGSVPALGHDWKLRDDIDRGEYVVVQCKRCKRVQQVKKNYYDSTTGKVNLDGVNCDGEGVHTWTTAESSGCERTLICEVCGMVQERDHDWVVTRGRNCAYEATCSVCGKTEKLTLHTDVHYFTKETGKKKAFKGEKVILTGTCGVCGKTDSVSFYGKSETGAYDDEKGKASRKLFDGCHTNDYSSMPSYIVDYLVKYSK